MQRTTVPTSQTLRRGGIRADAFLPCGTSVQKISGRYAAARAILQASPHMHSSGSACSRRRRRVVAVAARYGNVQRGTPEVVDRIIAAAPYMLPFLNSFAYARFLYHTQPLIRAGFQPLMPIITPFHSIPFASFIAFFAIYLGIAQNAKMSRFVRFNAIQAVLLDILLVLPRLVEVIITPPLMGWGKQLYINLNSCVWVTITALVVFGICNALLGHYGRIPFIAEAADQQIR